MMMVMNRSKMVISVWDNVSDLTISTNNLPRFREHLFLTILSDYSTISTKILTIGNNEADSSISRSSICVLLFLYRLLNVRSKASGPPQPIVTAYL